MRINSVRIFCSLGILGALLMFMGDMFLYGHFGSGNDFMKNLPLVISKQPDIRIIIGGAVGPIASLLYCLGFFSVYQMISPRSKILAIIASGIAAASIIIGGTYHAMWGIRALLIKAGLSSGDYHGLYDQIKEYTFLFYNSAQVLGGLASLIILFCVLSKRSLYPRWTAIVNPGFLLLFSPLSDFIPSPLGAVACGGYINLVFIIFFSVTLISTQFINHEDLIHAT